MKEKLVTIALLPYSQAEVLRSRFEAEGIACSLEHVNLIQGAVATGVKVNIQEKDIKQAYPILDRLMGKPVLKKQKTENTVLIPVDFSEYSFKAALVAFEIAKKLKLKMIFYHVIPQPDFFTVPYTDVVAFDSGLYEHMKEREEQAGEDLKTFLLRLTGYIGQKNWDDIKSEHIIKMGYPEDDILYFAEEHPPRLIIMGIKGPSDNFDIMGSTTAGVIYKSQVPVLVIPEKAPLLNLASIKRVAYATNFDEKDFISIGKLLGLLKPFDTELFCLHIGKPDEKEWNEARIGSMNRLLQKSYKNTKIECVTVPGTDLLNDLEDYIQTHKIDILSLTTHKRNMITRFFNPSIARKMTFHTRTPLLVFHS